jgi:hypothetical protein
MAEDAAVNGNIRFSTDAGTWVVDIASIKNTIAFERHFNVSAQVLQMAPRLEYIAFMAWTAARGDGLPVAAKFDDFIDTIVDIEVVDDAVERDANPTDGEQSAEH